MQALSPDCTSAAVPSLPRLVPLLNGARAPLEPKLRLQTVRAHPHLHLPLADLLNAPTPLADLREPLGNNNTGACVGSSGSGTHSSSSLPSLADLLSSSDGSCCDDATSSQLAAAEGLRVLGIGCSSPTNSWGQKRAFFDEQHVFRSKKSRSDASLAEPMSPSTSSSFGDNKHASFPPMTTSHRALDDSPRASGISSLSHLLTTTKLDIGAGRTESAKHFYRPENEVPMFSSSAPHSDRRTSDPLHYELAAFNRSSDSATDDFSASDNESLGQDLDRRQKKIQRRDAWTEEEDQALIDFIATHGATRWRHIANHLQLQLKNCNKDHTQCAQHWRRVLAPRLQGNNGRARRWTLYEDCLLMELSKQHEALTKEIWEKIALSFQHRTAMQCEYRYHRICQSNAASSPV